MNQFVRKGEEGLVILAPMVSRTKSDELLTENDSTRIFRFRAAHVLMSVRPKGKRSREFAIVNGAPKDYTEQLNDFVVGLNMKLEYDGRIAPAKGLSSGGKITLCPR